VARLPCAQPKESLEDENVSWRVFRSPWDKMEFLRRPIRCRAAKAVRPKRDKLSLLGYVMAMSSGEGCSSSYSVQENYKDSLPIEEGDHLAVNRNRVMGASIGMKLDRFCDH
jgi:hypothetical protein